jgi:hypothetical protein
MIPFTRDDLKAMMDVRQNPSISIYLPVARMGTETRQAPVRLRALLKKAEEILRNQNYRQPLIDKVLAPVAELTENALFWEHQQEGLAIFAGETGMQSRLLPFGAEESLIVADRFMVRPLLPLLQYDGQYFLLALNLSAIKLYRGSRAGIEPLIVPGAPSSLQDLLATYDQERQLRQRGGRGSGGAASRMFHGYENLKYDIKIRIEEYLRHVDAAVSQVLAGENLPLVVACVDYLFPLYRQINQYAALLEDHVSGSPDTLPEDTLTSQAWAIVEPVFEQAKEKAWAECQNLTGSGRVAGNIRQIIAAAEQGRVEALFLPAGRLIPGTMEAGQARPIRNGDPQSISRGEALDLLEVAAATALHKGGAVYEIEAARLPAETDALAMLRY